LCYFPDYARDFHILSVSSKEFATFFEKKERTTRGNFPQDRHQPGVIGRYSALDEQSGATLVAMLLDTFQTGQVMANKQLLQAVQERRTLKLTQG
jgi:hypothetical protein